MRAGAYWVVGQRIDAVQTATEAGRAIADSSNKVATAIRTRGKA
jgi:hypothetical protein